MGAYPNPGMLSGSAGGGKGVATAIDMPRLPGSNQYTGIGYSGPGNTPAPTSGGGSSSNPFQTPMYPSPYTSNYNEGSYGAFGNPSQVGMPGSSHNLGHGIIATGLQYPGLSDAFANYLMSQVGGGMTPFNMSTQLPTGAQTQPGQLTAGLNPLLQQLQNFFMGGSSNIPGMNTMGQIASQGVSALPEWQSMIAAQQQNIGQNQANLAEQFGSMGDLAGSPFGTAMSNYMQQTTLDQNSLLAQLQQSNIQNIQMPAIESMFGGAQAMGGGLQSLDQQAIQNMYQEFQRVQPQNNPMMQYIGQMSTLFPPTTKTPTTMDAITSLIGALSGAGYSSSGGSNPSTTYTF